MKRYKSYAAINILGLATGIATCLLIFIFVFNELSFDRFNRNANTIYRLVFDYKFPDKLDHLAVASPGAVKIVRRDFPEVENYTTITPYSNKLLVKFGETRFYEQNVYIADSTFFTVFDYKLISGNKLKVLNEPNTVVISKSTAVKYFGSNDPIGKVLEYDNNDGTFASYKVTGVFEDVPPNSHLVFNSLVSYKTFEVLFGKQALENWHNAGSLAYLQLKPNTNVQAFERKIEHIYNKYAAEYKNVKASISMHLEPLTSIHLHSDRLFDQAVKGNSSYVYIFSVVAVFLLLIACINYINLSTAQGKVRMKETGIRKVIGASRKELVMQFVTESALVVIFSVIISQLFILFCIPLFNRLTGLQVTILDIYALKNLIFIVLLVLCVIMLAGIYPAFYLTSYTPVVAIRSNTSMGEKGITLRKALVILQFTISIALISATLIVRSQVSYMMNFDPGFKRDNVMALRFQDTLTGFNYNAIKNEMLKVKEVKYVAQTSVLPGDPPDRKITEIESQSKGVINEIPIEPIWVDHDYFALMNIHLKEGRWFDRNRRTDIRESFVVNESAARKLGWTSSIDKKIIWGRGPRQRNGKVIGVTRDIYTSSLRNDIEPIVFICDENPSRAYTLGYMLVRIDAANKEETLKKICEIWSSFDKVHPPEYKFLEDNLAKQYDNEQHINELFQYLSLLTIVIACLGLLGLVSFSVSQRVKEIGIRKVLGASVVSVTALLSKDFLKLVGIAFVIAAPIGWFAMHKWLQDFAFRISVPWWVFLLSGIIAFAIALVTISVQAIRAALANPVKSLRTE